jgi:hypothetical protein
MKPAPTIFGARLNFTPPFWLGGLRCGNLMINQGVNNSLTKVIVISPKGRGQFPRHNLGVIEGVKIWIRKKLNKA